MEKISILNNNNFKQKFYIVILIAILITLVILGFGLNKIKQPNTKEEMTYIAKNGKKISTEYKDLGKFQIKIPKEFKIMSEELLKIKYPLGNIPKKAYSNEDGSISIVYNTDTTFLSTNKVTDYVDAARDMFSKMGYKSSRDTLKVDGIEVHTISLVTKAIDASICNYMVIFSIDDELVILNFNYIEEYKNEWSDFGQFMVKSIKMK